MDAVTLTEEIARLAGASVPAQSTVDGVPTFWLTREQVRPVLSGLKARYPMFYDLTLVDERLRAHREGQPESDFTLVYHLFSLAPATSVRLKLPLFDTALRAPSVVDLWPAADWYEREAFDMFGVRFEGHPHLRRILLPPWWEGHPLRKEYPARATENPVFSLPDETQVTNEELLRFRPEEWGLARSHGPTDYMFLNLGPNHPSVHGVFRIVLQLDGEEIVEAVPDIGFHHRAAEKMAERQSWHTYIPYTDRVDYLGGVMNNLPYLLAVERLAGIAVPPRAQVIRIMLCELFRIASHLVFYGTFAQDIGQLSPVFYMFTDRERLFGIIEAICGGRMHPNWFRIGGVAQDLPQGWDRLVKEFVDYLPARMDEYDRLVLDNRIVQARTVGIGAYDTRTAVEWGVTGPGLRATGLAFDLRKCRPYAGYEQFDFDIPVAPNGDAYDRCVVRAQEIRQSLRIVRQCLDNMPEGPYKADHPLATPPMKEYTLRDIETLIHHFLGVSWGPVIPAGEAEVPVEATKGINSYYLVSDGGVNPYRTRIRTPSFPHLQMLPMMCRGLMVPDLIAILGSIDFVMADVDR
jgi:NADH-quinone oxidoreductase subunit C/D